MQRLAVIWDVDVVINQLIECEIYFELNSCLDRNFEFLFFYFAAWHNVERNKRKHDRQVAKFEFRLMAFFVGVVANQVCSTLTSYLRDRDKRDKKMALFHKSKVSELSAGNKWRSQLG